jgi:hypothetical protein
LGAGPRLPNDDGAFGVRVAPLSSASDVVGSRKMDAKLFTHAAGTACRWRRAGVTVNGAVLSRDRRGGVPWTLESSTFVWRCRRNHSRIAISRRHWVGSTSLRWTRRYSSYCSCATRRCRRRRSHTDLGRALKGDPAFAPVARDATLRCGTRRPSVSVLLFRET